MPIYEYVCEKCGKLNEVMQKVNDPAPAKCDGCGASGTMSRIVSRTSFVLKGGGWYSDLYSSSKKGGSKSSESSSSSSGSSPSKTSSSDSGSSSSSSGSSSGGTSGSSTPSTTKT